MCDEMSIGRRQFLARCGLGGVAVVGTGGTSAAEQTQPATTQRAVAPPRRRYQAVRVLEYGGTLPWLCEGTPYQKIIDPEGVTTEFIRCPDPTQSGVVAKITRTRV